MKAKHVLLAAIIALAGVLLFSLIDIGVHSLSDEYAVPPRYFPNKILYGSLIALGALLVLRKQKLWTKVLVTSALVSVLLQLRYLFEGYPLDFVLLFLVIHFVALIIALRLVLAVLRFFGHEYS